MDGKDLVTTTKEINMSDIHKDDLTSLEADPNRLDFLQARKADLTALAKSLPKKR